MLNNHYAELAAKMFLNYYVIFRSDSDDMSDYQPVITLDRDTRESFCETMHLLDKELVKVFPAIWYIMHLPRIGFDVIDLDEKMILQAYDQPNSIFPIPSDSIQERYLRHMPRATLIIYEDGYEDQATQLQTILGSTLGIIGISQLNNESLKNHWNGIWENVKSEGEQSVLNNSHLMLHEYDKREILPLTFLANQLGDTQNMLTRMYNSSDLLKDSMTIQANYHAHLDVWRKALNSNKAEQLRLSADEYKQELNRSFKRVELPVVITLPGIAPYQVKYNRSSILPNEEKEAIRMLGIHRSIARNAIYIELNMVPRELFDELNSLELNCKRGTNNEYIWRTLKKIGKILSQQLTQEQQYAIQRASHITVFSDFPIGLAIFDGESAPLCCYKSISYRPLTPLTKALQYELPKHPVYYIGKKFKVLIAECLKKDDHIRPHSDHIWKTLIEMSNEYQNLEVIYSEIHSVYELKEVLKENTDADCLLISAHGSYNKQNNMAGLDIGDEIWMADDNDLRLPPLVILSSCHVSPRGSGVVSVADLLIRSGAQAVLGTFIPVNVQRNGLLMIRLFLYIAETQSGKERYQTLDEVWKFIVASNAINEILQSSNALKLWSMTKKPDGSFPAKEFQHHKSIGRLRLSHIYEDTITVLGEMLKGEKLEAHFKSLVESNDFYPESLFYQFIGYPENIFIYNEVFEKAMN